MHSLCHVLLTGYGLHVCGSTKLGKVDHVLAGNECMMEADLRSSQPENRVLYFFIAGAQQKAYFTHLPPTVQFAVCYLPLFLSSLSFEPDKLEPYKLTHIC